MRPSVKPSKKRPDEPQDSGLGDSARRVDYEDERAGTAGIFPFAEPLAGRRHVRVREQRTKVDWAIEMEELLRTRHAAAEKVILVCDNLNTHTRGAFYGAFPADQARAPVRRLEFRDTPQARPLAEHRGERTEFSDPSRPHRPPDRRPRDPAQRNDRLARRQQQPTTRRRLAIPNRRSPHEVEIPLPQILSLTKH